MIALKAAAIVMWLVAAGFGIPTAFVAAHLLREGTLPIFMGLFPAYGGGLFEKATPEWFAVALGAFAAVCAADAFAAWLIWDGHRAGGLMLIALLPLEALFWIGFALPIPPVCALIRAALLVAGWSSLR